MDCTLRKQRGNFNQKLPIRYTSNERESLAVKNLVKYTALGKDFTISTQSDVLPYIGTGISFYTTSHCQQNKFNF